VNFPCTPSEWCVDQSIIVTILVGCGEDVERKRFG
jgi:hypothetical protein